MNYSVEKREMYRKRYLDPAHDGPRISMVGSGVQQMRDWRLIGSILVVVGACSFGQSSLAELILEQPRGHLRAQPSDTAFRYFGTDAWEQIADDIVLGTNASINKIAWWGSYGFYDGGIPVNPPVGDETMRIRFYAPDASNSGLPGVVLYEESFLNPLRSATGEFVYGGGSYPEYYYQVDLPVPFTILMGERRWLEIVQVGDPASWFSLELGEGNAVPYAINYIDEPFWQYQHPLVNIAFQLYGVPEPVSFGVALMIIFVMSRKRKQERR